MTTTAAAAELVRQIEPGRDCYPETYGYWEIDALRTLAAEYLALVRPDDATPISEDWLRSVGFEADSDQAEMQLPEFWHPDWPEDRTKTSLIVHYDGTLFLSQGHDEAIQWPVKVTTRGTVRALARVLGIPLTGEVQ